MSVRENFGLSEQEWLNLGSDLQERLTVGQARLSANQQLTAQAMLEDDDAEIRNRTRHVERSLLNQNANDCVDTPQDMPAGAEDVRITVLGDVNGNEAIEMLQQQHSQNQAIQPQPQPMPQPQPNSLKNAILPFLLGAAIAGPIGGWAGYSWQTSDSTTFNAPGTSIINQPAAFGLDGSKKVEDG